MLVLLIGCLDHDLAPGDDTGAFVAMQSDFVGFTEWERTTVDPTDTGGHGDSTKSVYLNAPPPEGSTAFPVGTILVKVTPTDDGRDVHAMAKRGGGYNADGASGWEWFDLVFAEDGATLVIVWRGTEPPDGSGYGSASGDTASAIGDCNTCHAAAWDNDYVYTVGL